ncbi:galactose-specific lectin nattectin-like [Elgaria multicarinata webbii]|uniref:galactose-specific lectin nattectin-like n=1 Tax=Elgaria multicarinata webbii TaxID=159646 RepID=UPI002FCCE134
MQPYSAMDEDYQNEDHQNDSVSEELSQTWEWHSEPAETESVTSDQGYENAEQEYEYIMMPDMRMRSLPETGMKAEPALFLFKDDKLRDLGRKLFIAFCVLLLLSLIMVTAALVLACLRCFLACPSEWLEFQQKCYNFAQIELKWADARSSCQDQGADLLVIDNEKEQDFLVYKIYGDSDTWIGLNYTETEREWKWVDGTSVSYKNWDISGDIPLMNSDGYLTHCATAKEDVKYKWRNAMCKKRKLFICEKGRRLSCVLQSPLLLQ